MEFIHDDDDFVVTPRTKHRFNQNGTPNIKNSSCSPSSGRSSGNTQSTAAVSSVQTSGSASLSKGRNGNGKVYRMVQSLQNQLNMITQANRSRGHSTSKVEPMHEPELIPLMNYKYKETRQTGGDYTTPADVREHLHIPSDEAVSKAGIKEGEWLSTSPKKNQQCNSYMTSGSKAPSLSQTSELKENNAQVKPNKYINTITPSSSISKHSQSSVHKSLDGISRPSSVKISQPPSVHNVHVYTSPNSPHNTLDCKADKLPEEDDVDKTPTAGFVKRIASSLYGSSRLEVIQLQKLGKPEEILKSKDGKCTASRRNIVAKRPYDNSVCDWKSSGSGQLNNKLKQVKSNYESKEPVLQLNKIDKVINLNTAWPSQDKNCEGKFDPSDSECYSDQSDIVIAETPFSKNKKRVQRIDSDSDESEDLFNSKQSEQSDSSHVEFLSIKNSRRGLLNISDNDISDSTHMDIDSQSDCTIEEILSSSDEQVNITVSTDNDPESPVPRSKQKTQANFVLDKFGTESSSESDCPISYSNVSRHSKKGREHNYNRALESENTVRYGSFSINKGPEPYNSALRKETVKPSAVERSRENSAEKSFGSVMENKRKNCHQQSKRKLSLSSISDSEELPIISRPKHRRLCRPQILSESTSSSYSETRDLNFGEMSFLTSGAPQNSHDDKISDTSLLEKLSDPDVDTSGTEEFSTPVESPAVTYDHEFPSVLEKLSDPDVDTSGTEEFLTPVESPAVIYDHEFPSVDVEVISLSTSEDSDVPLVELLERRKKKKSLSTSKLSDKSDQTNIKLDVTSVKQEIVSSEYLEQTVLSPSKIDEQSRDINEDDSNTTSFRDTKDSSEDKTRKKNIHSLLDRLKMAMDCIKKDQPLSSVRSSPAKVLLLSSMGQNTGKIVENFDNKINENEKIDIHEKSNQVQNEKICTLETGIHNLVNNKEQVETDVSIKTEPSSSYTQEPECIFVDDEDDIDDEYFLSLSQRDNFIDVDDGDKEEEEKKWFYADEEGVVEDVKVKIEMDSEAFEIKDPEFWEDYEQMSEEDFDGYEDLVEPTLIEKSALVNVKEIKTEIDTSKHDGEGEEVSAGRNVLSSKENDHNMVTHQRKVYLDSEEKRNEISQDDLSFTNKNVTRFVTVYCEGQKELNSENVESLKELVGYRLLTNIKTEIHSDEELCSTMEGEDYSGHEKQDDDGLSGADFLSGDDEALYAAVTQVDSGLASKASTSIPRNIKLVRDDDDIYSALTQVPVKSVSKMSRDEDEEMDSEDDHYLAATQLDVQELGKDNLGYRSPHVNDDKSDPYLAMTQLNSITAKGIKGMEMFNNSSLNCAAACTRNNFVSPSGKHQELQVKDWMDSTISREDPLSIYSEMTQVDRRDEQGTMEVSRADDIDVLNEAYMDQTQVDFCTKEKTKCCAEVLKDSHACTLKAQDKIPKMVSISSGELCSRQKPPLLSHAADLGPSSAHTVPIEASCVKSIRVRQPSQKDAAQRRTLEIEPQRKKSTKEIRMEFKAQNLYHSKYLNEGSSGAAEKLWEETSDSRSNWLSKNSKITPERSKSVQEKKITPKDTDVKKSKERKRRKSQKEPAFSLTQGIQDAKCRLVDRNFQTVVRPESVAEGYKKKFATVVSEDVEDVELPTDSQILNQGLPLLCPRNPLLTSHKKLSSSRPHARTSSHSLELVKTSSGSLVTSNSIVTMAASNTVTIASVSTMNSLSVVTTSVNTSSPTPATVTITTVSTTYTEPLVSTSRKSATVSSSSIDREKVVISTSRSSNPTSRQSSREDATKSPGFHDNQTGGLTTGPAAVDLVSSILAQSKSNLPHFKHRNSSHGSNVMEKPPLGSSLMHKNDVKHGSKDTKVKHKEKDAQQKIGSSRNLAEKTKDMTKKCGVGTVNPLAENVKPKGIHGRMSNRDYHERRHSVETSMPRVGGGREVSQHLRLQIDKGKPSGTDGRMSNRDYHERRHSVEASRPKVGDGREVNQHVRLQIDKGKPKGSEGKMSNRDYHERRHSVEASRPKVGDGREVNQPVRLQMDQGNIPVNAVAPMLPSNLPDLEEVVVVTESTSQLELLNRVAAALQDQQRQLSNSGKRQNEGHDATQVQNFTAGNISIANYPHRKGAEPTATIEGESHIIASAFHINGQHHGHDVAQVQNFTAGNVTPENHSDREGTDPTSTIQGGAQINASSLYIDRQQQDNENRRGEIPLSVDQEKFKRSEPGISTTIPVKANAVDNMHIGLPVTVESSFVAGKTHELKTDSGGVPVPTDTSLCRLYPENKFSSSGPILQQSASLSERPQQPPIYGVHVQTSRDTRKAARQNSNDPSRHADAKHNPFQASFRTTTKAAQQVAGPSTNLMRLDCQNKLPQLDDFLIFILKWNPVWLTEQKEKLTKENRTAEPPPVAGQQKPFPLVEKYSSFEEYCHTFMVPLLLYEAWECSFRGWKERKEHGNTICHKLYQGCYVIDKERHRSSCKIVEYVGHALISKEDWSRGRYITEGDIVWLNIYGTMIYENKNQSSQPDWFPQMAYVENVTIKTDGRSVLRVLNMVPPQEKNRPDFFVYMKFVFKIRWRKFRPEHEKPSQVHQISSLVTTIRQYCALSLLPRSPLCCDILNPTCNVTFLDKETYVDPSLKVHYNRSQAEAIATITKMVLSPYAMPKICLLQGPPGTGKSYTIIALIKKIMKDTNGRAKICVCAPSNAAVDVLMKRLVEHNRSRPDKTLALKCVRIGKLDTMHEDVKAYSLLRLLEKNIKSLKLERMKKNLPESLINQRLTLLKKISVKKAELNSVSGDSVKIARIKNDLKALEKDKNRIENQMEAQAEVRLTSEEESNLRRNILLKADIIAGTLCGLGGAILSNILKRDDKENKEAFFKCIIVDEATQATELDCLIPLQYGSSKLVLVGDPEQLPPTVVSQVAAENKFGQSLFERFYSHFKYSPINPVMMLNTQYRMDLEICSFPNSYIYEKKIMTDPSVYNRSQRLCLRPYLLFDISDGHELLSQSGSLSNPIEAEFTVKLCKFVLQTQKLRSCDVGIIAPYQNQKKLLKDLLRKSNIRDVEVGTVDGFQGREKCVIIMSCVRAKNPTGTIGFVGSRQRMNVALTRAKCACYIVGDIESLQTNEEWRALINDAKERKLIIPVHSYHDAEINLKCCVKISQTRGKSDIS